jgi:hypothetical protein
MTQAEAIRFYDSKWWEHVPLDVAAGWQLFESRLCMPFDLFHRGIEAVLGRPVFTHEFAYVDTPGGLRAEALRLAPAPTLTEICDLIPADKRIVVVEVKANGGCGNSTV